MELSRSNLTKSLLMASAIAGAGVLAGQPKAHADVSVKATQEPHQVQVNNVQYYSSKTDSEYNDQHAAKIQVVNGVYDANDAAKAQADADKANAIKAQKEKQAQEAKKKAEEQKKRDEQQKAQAEAEAKKKAEEQAKQKADADKAAQQAKQNDNQSSQSAPQSQQTANNNSGGDNNSNSGGSANPSAGLSMSEQQAKEWIANRESSGNYNARNGRYYGRYQLDISYLGGDLSPQHQDEVANNYVKGRYGGWAAAQAFWQRHGYY